jgi:hypothetical protein
VLTVPYLSTVMENMAQHSSPGGIVSTCKFGFVSKIDFSICSITNGRDESNLALNVGYMLMQ